MWMQWEKELTPNAAEEDANRLFASISEVMREILVYYLIFPRVIKDLYYNKIVDIESAPNTDFLQLLFDRIGFNNTDFRELIIPSVRNVYKYIVSDLDSCGLASEDDELVKVWSRLLYMLYPVISPYYRKEFHPTSKKNIEIKIHSDEVLSTAVSPRFMYAMRMLSLRQHIVGKLTAPYVIDANDCPIEYTPHPNKQLPKELATMLEETKTISAPDLAFLASVSYQYVTKLVRANRINARKKGKFILIPIDTAVSFVISRPTAPKWIKMVADRAKIVPLNF